MLYYGRGVPKDEVEAMRWFLKAAYLFDPTGQKLISTTGASFPFRSLPSLIVINILGVSALRGLGMKFDQLEALQWYAKAAKLDFPPAQYMLGTLSYLPIVLFSSNIEWLVISNSQYDSSRLRIR